MQCDRAGGGGRPVRTSSRERSPRPESHLSQPIYIVVQTRGRATLGGTRIAGTGGSFTVRGLTDDRLLDV